MKGPGYGECFLNEGVTFNPSVTSVGPISTPEALYLGKQFDVFVAGKRRTVRIVKNTHNAVLTAGQVLKYSTTSSASGSRWRKDVVLSTADTDQVAGVVEQEYKAGVPINYWFRMVEYAEQHDAYIGTTNSARYTLVAGDPLVASDDDGYVWKQNGAAANNAVQNRLGFLLYPAVVNQTDNLIATKVQIEVNVLNR